MSQTIEIKVPDIGDFHDVPVLELLVKAGDKILADATLVTLESEKAAMEVPAQQAGTVKEVRVRVGDNVSKGSVILLLETEDSLPSAGSLGEQIAVATEIAPTPAAVAALPVAAAVAAPAEQQVAPQRFAHASPSIRSFARRLGANVDEIRGSGPNGRILKEDVQAHVKAALAERSQAASGANVGLNLLPWPRVDFAKFGPIERQALSRIQKLSAANLARNWIMIPHVTQFDAADITELEDFRSSLNREKSETKITLLAFVIKAAAYALTKFPQFNASLDGDQMILKRYIHIGFAADTPEGLVVPVIRDANRKGVVEIAKEAADLARRAREGKLSLAEMQGGSFSISSLGGIGGSAFTPIINAPEVAILGVAKSETKPKWNGAEFEPRLMLPLALSYDHRAIDGAAGARFITLISGLLGDLRRTLL